MATVSVTFATVTEVEPTISSNAQWPDYRTYFSPETLYIFHKNDLPHRHPRKIPKKIQAKAIQGHVPWMNLKKKFQISFSQYANNIGTSLFRSMLQAQNTDTHARISWGCPKIVCHCDPISLLINTFGIHLEPGCKSHEQIMHYHTAKNVLNKRQFCSIFRRNYKVTRKGFPVV